MPEVIRDHAHKSVTPRARERSSAYRLARRNPAPLRSVDAYKGWALLDVRLPRRRHGKQKRPAVLVVEDEPLMLMDALDLVTDAGFDAVGKNADEAIRILE